MVDVQNKNDCPPGQQEGAMRKLLRNEVVIAASIIAAAFSVFGVYKQMSDRQLIVENKLDYIEKNHLTHIEASITEIRKEQQATNKAGAERDKRLERILTILEEHQKTTKNILGE